MKNYWINSGLYTFLQRFSTLVFGFGGFYMLIRMQSKSEFGVWALVISVTALLEVARNGLIQNGLIKFSIGASENDQAQIQTAALFLNIALTIVSCIFLFFSGPYFETIWHASSANYLLKLYCLTSIALIPFQQFSYIQQAKFDFKGLFIMTLIRQGSFFFVILYYSINFHHIDLHDLGWWFLASAVLSSAAGFFIVKNHLTVNALPSAFWVKKLFNYGKYSFGTNVSGMLFNSIDQFMLGSMTGTAQVAIYNASCKINNLIDVPISTVASIVFPQTSLKANMKDTNAIKEMYEKSVSILLAMILPILLIISIVPKLVLTLIAGPSYAEFPGVLLIILLFSVLQPFSRQFGTVMDSIGKPNINFYCISISAIVNLLLNLILIPFWGIYGAALSTLITLLLSVIVNIFILKYYINIDMMSILKGMQLFYKYIYTEVVLYFKVVLAKRKFVFISK